MNCFRANLINLRKQSARTQQQIADALNIDRSTYSHWELGDCQPCMDRLIDIASFYKISVDNLLGVCNGTRITTDNQRFFQQYFTANDKIKKAVATLLELS